MPGAPLQSTICVYDRRLHYFTPSLISSHRRQNLRQILWNSLLPLPESDQTPTRVVLFLPGQLNAYLQHNQQHSVCLAFWLFIRCVGHGSTLFLTGPCGICIFSIAPICGSSHCQATGSSPTNRTVPVATSPNQRTRRPLTRPVDGLVWLINQGSPRS